MMKKVVKMFILVAILSMVASAQTVSRKLSDAKSCRWKKDWSTANGSIFSCDEVPSGNDVDSEVSMKIPVQFERSFAYYNISPAAKDVFRGNPVKFSVWARQDGELSTKFSFIVKNRVKGKKYDWNLKLTKEWQKFTFAVPGDWSAITNIGFTVHNWNKKGQQSKTTVYLNNLMVFSEVGSVKDKNSLVNVVASTGRERNIFNYNEKVKYNLNIESWLGKKVKGQLKVNVTDYYGTNVYSKEEQIEIETNLLKRIEFQPVKYGIYRVNIDVKLDGLDGYHKRSSCAFIPEIEKSTEEEKSKSPWGLNIHGATIKVGYNSIAQLGFCWIRDYAYTYTWLTKGYNNGSWDGWPWYIPFSESIKESGLKLLATNSGGIKYGIKENPEPAPDWRNPIIRFMMRFPEYDAFEPDNELDLHMPKELAADNYQSYGKYHSHYADVVHFMNPKARVTSQGTAGFKSHIVRQMVKEGYFENIDVINAHFYTGIYPALLSQRNENTNQGKSVPRHFYDRLREFVEAADCDGKKREKWVTEFGWDTLAVKIVTEKEKSAYAQRGYTTGFIGGLDKMFWYWNVDAQNPGTYFDGMGIFDKYHEPNPVAVAIAAMIHFLKLPEPVGSFEMGDNTYGHVFRDRGRLVALAFKIDKNKPGRKVTFASGKLYDMYGNPLSGRTHMLDIDPIWIDGISPDDLLVKETIYSLKSDWLTLCATGDDYELKVEVNNTRSTQVDADLTMELPDGWKIVENVEKISVPAGMDKVFTVKIKIPEHAEEGSNFIKAIVTEGKVVKVLNAEVKIVPLSSLGSLSLVGNPGTSDLTFTVANNSSRAHSFIIKPNLPSGWKADPESLKVDNIPAYDEKNVSFKVTWNNEYSEKDKAEIAVYTQEGKKIVSAGITPGASALPLAGSIKFDGDFSDWPEGAKIPDWAVGVKGTTEKVEMYTAYSAEGLYVGVKLEPSGVIGDNPEVFWSMDCLEVCVDTMNDKTKRKAYNKTDHQFWVVPTVKNGQVYVGRWKRNNEIPEMIKDLQGVKSASVKTADGYAMEFMIPADKITGFKAQKGNKIGLTLNLTSPNRLETISCYWPLPKSEGVISQPYKWVIAEMK